MERYLLKHFLDNANGELEKRYLEYLKVILNGRLYGDGDHMSKAYKDPQSIRLRNLLGYLRKLLKSHYVKSNSDRDRILSFVKMPPELESTYNLEFASSILFPICSKNIFSLDLLRYYFLYLRLTRSKKFYEIIDDGLFAEMQELEAVISEQYLKYRMVGLIIPNCEPFLYNLHLDIFKKLQIPSFTVLHGLPGIYDLESEKKADYLLVWGEQIKQNYIDVGFDSERVKVIGHPRYQEVPKITKLRNSLDDVLVATTGSVQFDPYGWEYDKFPLFDRNLLLVYCYSVEKVLKKLGVKHARLRAHPSVGLEWLEKFVDMNFYTVEKNGKCALSDSLNRSSLVIGPTSSVWLESVLYGVNYIVYEPGDGKNNLSNAPLVPPFDGSDSYLDVAFDEDALFDMIKHGYQLNTAILDKYISPFNFEEANKLLKR